MYAIQLTPKRYATLEIVNQNFVDQPIEYHIQLYDYDYDEFDPIFEEWHPSLLLAYQYLFEYAKNFEMYVKDVLELQPIDSGDTEK